MAIKGKPTRRHQRSTKATPRQLRESAISKPYEPPDEEDEHEEKPEPCPYRNLAIALVKQAVLDLRLPADNLYGAEARVWLAGPDASLWLEMLDIDLDILRERIQGEEWETAQKAGRFWGGARADVPPRLTP